MANDNLGMFDFNTSDVTPEEVLLDGNDANGLPQGTLLGDQANTDSQNAQTQQDGNSGNTDNWEVRAKYFQSQYDKVMAQNNQIAPIANFLAANPEAIEALREIMTKKVAPQEDVFALPQKPVKPSNFNIAEAYNDPDSESAKYLNAHQDYTEKLTAQQEKITLMRQQEYQRQKEAEMQQSQYQQQIGQLSSELTTKYGMNRVEVADFINEMQKEEAITLDNLVALYKLRKNPQGQQRFQQVQQQGSFRMPPPPSVGGGGNVQRQSNANDIWLSELANSKR